MNIHIKHILFSFVIILIGCNLSFSQTRISEKFASKTLNEVLETISKNYTIKFAYDNSAVNHIIVSGNFNNEPIDEVLKYLLNDSHLDYILINDVYIIKQKNPEPKEESKIIPAKTVKYKVLGIVKERETGESLPYASIAIVDSQNGTSTNADGYFSLSSDKSDSITIIISYLGYQPVRKKVVPLLKNDIITIELDRNTTAISEVVFVKTQQELLAVETSSGGAIQWNSMKNSDPPTLSNLDIAAPLQLLPGIDGTTESLSGLVVRHTPSDKNLFVYDGFTIYHIDHFFGAFTSFNSKAIKDIRITRGGFDSRWGGRTSSVIEITGKTGNENKLVVDIGADQLSSDVEIDGPIGKKTTFVLAARRSFTDIYRSNLYYNLFESARSDLSTLKLAPVALSTNPNQPGYFYYDLNAKISFKPGPKDVISVSGYKGYDDLKLESYESVPVVLEKSNWGNQGLGIRWSRQWNNIFYHNITVGVSQNTLYFDHYDYKLRKRPFNPTITDTISHSYLTDNNIDDINVNFTGELKLGPINTLEFGVSESNVSINALDGYSQYSFGNKIIDTLKIYDNRVNDFTFWTQNTISKGALKAFKFGGRITYNSLTNLFYLEPRTQLSIELSKKFSIKMAAGLYYQFVNKILTYNTGSFRSIWRISDEKRFPVVQSIHIISGFNWDMGSRFSLDFEGYFKNTSNISFEQTYIKRTSAVKITQQQVVLLMDNKAFGADILLKKNWSRGQSWVSYSLSKSINQCDNLNGGEEYSAIDDHLNELKIVNVLDLKHWNFTVAWIYGSGKPWDEILLTSTLQISPDYEKNAAQLSSYHRMDVGISYNFKVKNGDFKVGAKIFNLYNNVNTLSKPFQLSDTPYQNYLDGISPIYYTEVPGMGFTTSFFVNLRF
jgi:ferric enterobactin receptor